ncbi:beta-propeller domain-containing protein, partial [Patescibacteria group bacterium]|nr:beta-propeller domain-containing protein [Patescibacteria group bacterium]
ENLKYQFVALFPKIIKPPIVPVSFSETKDIKKFASVEEFKTYLEEAKLEAEIFSGGAFSREGIMPTPLSPLAQEGMGGGGGEPERVSETTVQVPGVDEPDIVKTDGKEIYFSPSQSFRIWDGRMRILSEEKIQEAIVRKVETKIIKAFPLADLAIDSEIKGKSGDLLLSQNILVVFSAATNEIYGYDVSEPKSPTEKWKIKLDTNSGLVGARLYKNKIYLVAKNTINEIKPCPIKPLIVGETPLIIDCKEIYHPVLPIPVDVTFTAMVLDPVSGKIAKNTSFVGSSGQSLVYMSEKSIYITYNYSESIIKFYANFFSQKAKDLVPSSLIEKLKKLDGYDISQQSKLLEFQFLWDRYLNSLTSDERLKMENEFNNRLADYYKVSKRDLEKTGLVKIKLDELEISAAGNVPGYPLNQFALDEYNDELRIAVTVGERFGWGFGMGRGESSNDVYVLDNNLKILGQVLDLGLTEKIYSVRFIEDKGYVVTFRQTDPFYILDLSNPKNPIMAGELKIPGFSSYLHPLDQTHILGIGMEGSQVKISLFDVSNKNNPIELDKYILDEYWSEVANNYHAFLLDEKHKIFFLPGSKGGYVFSYFSRPECPASQKCLSSAEYRLNLKKAISQNSVKRAIYINDYLYIIGEDKITVLNEINWEKVKELELSTPVE